MAPVKKNETFSSIRTQNFPSFAGASINQAATTHIWDMTPSASNSYTLTQALNQ